MAVLHRAPAGAILAALFLSCASLRAQPTQQITPDSLALVSDRALEVKRTFPIYTNGDAPSHGFPSGKFATGFVSGGVQSLIDRLNINTHCVYDPSRPDGCSTDLQRVDCERGTVLRVQFPGLSGNESVGFNIEEPERFSDRPGTVGYDLRGATRLVFDIATLADSLDVMIGIAGKDRRVTVRRSDGWRTVIISFAELGVTAADLRDVRVLFSIGSNALLLPTGGGVVFLDNVRVEPVPDRQATAVGLPRSTQTCGVVQRSTEPVPVDQVMTGIATTYESALAAIALARLGDSQFDPALATIADALTYAVRNDNSGLAIPGPTDGSDARGIRSGYKAGELPLNNPQPAPLLGRRGQTQSGGFSVPTDTLCGPSRYCLAVDYVAGGDSAFAMIALVTAAKKLGTPAYADTARSIGNWMAANLRDTQGYGGFFNGYRNPGKNDADQTRKILDRGKSTENVADIAAAYFHLADYERAAGNAQAESRWLSLGSHAAEFVFSMYSPTDGRFLAGTVPPSAGGEGIKPDCGPARRGEDCLNREDFLDANTLAFLALAPRPEYRTRIDWKRPISWVLQHHRTSVVSNTTWNGFGLVPNSQGIAWEFTGQVALALKLLESIFPAENFATQAQSIVEQLRRAKASAPFTDGRGIPAATMADGNPVTGLRTPFQEIPRRVNLAATTFGMFAERNVNPLAVPPRFAVDGVVNGASFAPPPNHGVSPASYFTIFGANLASGTTVLTNFIDGKLPFVLGDTSVLVNGRCAPVVFASPEQVNVQAPLALSGATVTVEVRTGAYGNDCVSGGPGQVLTVPLRSLSPALFALPSNQVIAVHTDASLVTPQSPAQPGEIVILFGTGWGPTQRVIPEGQVPGEINRIVSPVTLRIGTVDVASESLLYAGLAPEYPGLYQLNVRLPASLPSGSLPVRFCVADVCSPQALTLSVR